VIALKAITLQRGKSPRREADRAVADYMDEATVQMLQFLELLNLAETFPDERLPAAPNSPRHGLRPSQPAAQRGIFQRAEISIRNLTR
jgi:hypothetical protein